MLRPKLRKLNDEDLVFASNENSRYAEINAEQKLRRAIVKVGLDMRYESTNRYYINTHSFRAYGITKISRHDPNFAKKIAGQKGYLDQYDRITDEEKLELYQKYEIDLIVDNSIKLKAEQDLLVNDSARKDKQIEDLQSALKGKEELTRTLEIVTMQLKHTDERMAIIESELPNFQITRIRKITNPKVLDANTKFYV
jgi:hypothetical protein